MPARLMRGTPWIGNEFKNKIINEILETFNIKRSLSKKGCLFDNAIAEAGYKIIKIEFAFNRIFKSLEELKIELRSYVLWYNNKRIHSALNYIEFSKIVIKDIGDSNNMTPVEYRLSQMTQ